VRALHTRAERGGIVSDVLNGRATLAGYVELLRNLLPCYEALETALTRHRDSPLLKEFARPALYRSEYIRTDLQVFSPNWQAGAALLDEGRAYAARIAACDEGGGQKLIAHTYARYLGDLNGGTIILRRLQPHLGGRAMQFHAFPEIDDLAAFKLDYRAAFDRAGAALEDWQGVLDEAAVAFRMNIALSEAVKKASASF
jgi:heme oxygenase